MDLLLFNLINGLAGKSQFVDWFGIFLSDYLVYFLVLTFLYLFTKEKSWRKRWYFFALTGLALLLSRGIITEAIRFFYARPRPFVALGIHNLVSETPFNSFPSGHAAFSFSLAAAVYYYLKLNETRENKETNKKWDLWFWAGAIFVGIGRIFVGVHWPTDIVAGALIGIASSYLIKMILPAPNGQAIPNSKY